MARTKASAEKPTMIKRALRKPKTDRPTRPSGPSSARRFDVDGFDWDRLTLDAVNSVIEAAEARRSVLRREAEAALRAEFEAKAAALGLTLSDLVGGRAEHPRGKRAGFRAKGGDSVAGRVRFRGPDGQTWSGRGPTPRWLKALEASGKPRGEFAV